MPIVFAGHRERIASTDDLDAIARQYTGATWVCGGCRSRFNLSVRAYARQHDIPCQVFRRAAGGTERFQVYAAMVAIADLVVAAYDGRVRGGTAFIVREAMRKGTRVVWLD